MGIAESMPESPPTPPPEAPPAGAPESLTESFNSLATTSQEPALTETFNEAAAPAAVTDRHSEPPVADTFNAIAESKSAELPPEEEDTSVDSHVVDTFNAAAVPTDAELPPEEPDSRVEPEVSEAFNSAAGPKDAEIPPENPNSAAEPKADETAFEKSESMSPEQLARESALPTPAPLRIVHESTAEAENARLQSEAESRGGTFEPAYAAETSTYAAVTDSSNLRTSRGYAHEAQLGHPEDGGAVGRWSTGEDMTAMTPQDLKQRYALPESPNHLVDLHHPAGQEVVIGTAGPNKFNEFGEAGGQQYEAIDKRADMISSPKADWNPETGQWDPRLSGTFNRVANPEIYPQDEVFKPKSKDGAEDA